MTASPPADRPALSVKVNDSDMHGIIRSIDVEDHDRLIDRARIIVQDADNVCTNFAQAGQKVMIEMGWGTQRAPIFEGYIRHVEGTDTGSYPRTVTITALDPSYFMHLDVRLPRSFTGKLSEIIGQVVEEYEQYFTVGEIILDNDVEFGSSNPLLQHNETDLQFIYRLANLYGARAFVEYNRQSGETTAASQFYFVSERTLMGGDRLATLRYCRGVSEIINFSYERVSSDAEPNRTAVTVNPATGIPPETLPAPEPTVGPPRPEVAAQISHIEQQGRSAASTRAMADAAQSAPVQPDDLRHHYASAGLPSNPNLIQEITRQDPTRILGYRGRGVAIGNVLLRAKSKIGIIGFSAWDEGDWYLHKVNHKITQDRESEDHSFRTTFEVSR